MSTAKGSDQSSRMVSLGPVDLNQALQQVAGRMESVLIDEEELLAGPHDAEAFERVITRKTQLVVEIARLAQHARGFAPDALVRKQLKLAMNRLAGNGALLRRHIDAVNEITTLIADICNQSSSDGTYTRYVAKEGRRL